MQLTARQAYIDILTELVKRRHLLCILRITLFLIAISEYMKTRYEVFETNQQLADDMRSWKKSFQASSLETPISSIYKSIPGTVKIDEYRHLLSCIIDVAISRL
jgi:hypothetical protein